MPDGVMQKPQVGDIVCDCRMVHSRVIAVEEDDMIVVEGGFRCSWVHCCDEPNHTWTHEEVHAEDRLHD